MTQTDAMQARSEAVMMNNYGTPPVALASADGAVVTDVDGKTYLDLLGGIAVNVLGHRHPAVIEAVTHQMATLGGQPTKQAPFAPLPGDVTHVPYGDTDALAAAVHDDTAAVFLEPIMGESGVVVPPEGYLAAARDITAGHGALLVLDEVQTGMGRTGAFFAHQHDGITLDVVTRAKRLGGGLPIAACLAVGPAADLLTPGLHGSTFGGNPISTAAARAVLAVLTTDELVRHAEVLGKSVRHRVELLDHPLVDQVRGRGLLLGMVLTAPRVRDAEAATRDAEFLVNAAAPDVIRLAPPLIITEAQIDGFIAALPGILDTAGAPA
ncbi:MAG TPA: aminotransferase class III-fold pyridoxal phosphate-dependent enzyme [Mycobacterium sp.]|nr:aminotransferase class III-fold pyridoxal phosphate-dependent enzyme [Mycobacterium sp.]HUH69526.1 aminotransferase class III-fold pyridoxal phosphate-dependent enzyme [Mycobacterium sp.]